MELIDSSKYRKDIDGLRAIAVVAVILFHFGLLPNGYLGVDIFFVISGYLITGIIYNEVSEKRFSIKNFYIRRTKRILPLVSFMCLISLIIGAFTMLPDDLENLGQSVIATNLFGNNILAVNTTKNYWDIVNEFKPLMHTWSLAIEEQYYLIYPFLFLILGSKKIQLIKPILIILTITSLVMFFAPFQQFYKFYLLPFRFFELSIGGIATIYLNKKLFKHQFTPLLIVLIILVMGFNMSFIPSNLLLFITILITTGILISANTESNISNAILENKIFIFFGKISFSLYMWHQVLLAFSRYFVFKELTIPVLGLIFIVTVLLSTLTYYLIEQPFRLKFGINKVILSLVLMFIITTGFSSYLYLNAGVIKDIPELEISKTNVSRNMHAKYNDNIYEYDKDFISTTKTKLLIIGNSFARDWVNVLLETNNAENYEFSYIYSQKTHPSLQQRLKSADIVFYSTTFKDDIIDYNIYKSKIWCIGTKNFGLNNGYFYNYNGKDYCNQRTTMESGYLEKNIALKKDWDNRYIDLIEMIIDENNTVPIFTNDCKFISQDCRHLTKSGAKHFARLLEDKKTISNLIKP